MASIHDSLEVQIKNIMDVKGVSRKSAIKILKLELDNSMEPPAGLLDWEDAPEYTKKNKKAVKAKRRV
jgi:hypothetical protein